MFVRFAQFFQYSCAAIISAFADWTLFWILNKSGIFFVYSQMIARIVGGATSFVVNKYWSFKSPQVRYMFLQSRRFIGLFVLSYFLSNFLLYFFVTWFDVQLYWAKLIGDTICFGLNFFIMKVYVYSPNYSLIKFTRNYINNLVNSD